MLTSGEELWTVDSYKGKTTREGLAVREARRTTRGGSFFFRDVVPSRVPMFQWMTSHPKGSTNWILWNRRRKKEDMKTGRCVGEFQGSYTMEWGWLRSKCTVLNFQRINEKYYIHKQSKKNYQKL